MSTLRQRMKEAKQLLKATYETVIIYAVVCRPTDTFEDAIEFYQTIEEARDCIKGINEQYIEEGYDRTRLYILPVVVDDDSYEPVTSENMMYYDLNSQWVKEYREDMEGFRNNLKLCIIS